MVHRNYKALPMRRVTIVGTGVAVPPEILTADEIDRRLNLPCGESFRITGIHKRHVAVDQTSSQLAAVAINRALQRAGMSWDQIDCLVCASATMDQALPYNAAMVLAELGKETHSITTMDIGASCLSFLQAMDMVSCALAVNRYRNVMIVSSDIASFTTDYRNLSENGFFGDGAAAAVLRHSSENEPSCILASRSMTLPQGLDYCRIRSGGSRYHRRGTDEHAQALFEMRGKPLFKLVAKHLSTFVDDLLNEANVTLSDLALLIPHQASRHGLDYLSKTLGFRDGCMVDVVSEFGNQVGASLPTALHFAIERYGLKRGQKVLLLGSGAGVSMGGIVMIY
jgi:3-oxoacyl-[acyl-carrier-protein] synthase-3